jgi:RHS repeat-associated protein
MPAHKNFAINTHSLQSSPIIKWNTVFNFQFSIFNLQYNYDAQGNRTRKVVEKGNIVETRYYINGYEVYRKEVNGAVNTERTTLNISDDEKVFARVDTLTIEDKQIFNYTPIKTVFYRHDNHLGSTCLELDEYGDIISYEEYYPFGTTSYRSGRSEIEVSLKRYKYCGKERDEETGLYYYGARYYAAWICRFVSVDPLWYKYPNIGGYVYCANNPIRFIDPTGEEIVIIGDEEYQKQIRIILNALSASGDAGKYLVNEAIKSDKTFVIANVVNGIDKAISESSSYSVLAFNIDEHTGTYDAADGGVDYNPVTQLAHELSHFVNPQRGHLLGKDGKPTKIRAGEVQAVEWENRVRKDIGMDERKMYGGMNVYGKEIEQSKGDGYYNLKNKKDYGDTNFSVSDYGTVKSSKEKRRAYYFGGKYIDKKLMSISYMYQQRLKF